MTDRVVAATLAATVVATARGQAGDQDTGQGRGHQSSATTSGNLDHASSSVNPQSIAASPVL